MRPQSQQSQLPIYHICDILNKTQYAIISKVYDLSTHTFRVTKKLNNAKFKNSFVVEKEITSQLSHPNIVQFFNQKSFNNNASIEMEHVSGPSLRHLIRRQPFNETIAVLILYQIIKGVEYLHSKKVLLNNMLYDGIVHRDLKPENILIDYYGVIKIIDFSIAQPEFSNLMPLRKRTIDGTLPYLSPNYIKTKHVSKSVDIYALGCLAYEMVTGNTLFMNEPSIEATYLSKMVARNDTYKADGNSKGFNNFILKCIKSDCKHGFKTIAESRIYLEKHYNFLTSRIFFDIISKKPIKDQPAITFFTDHHRQYDIRLFVNDLGTYNQQKKIATYTLDIIKLFFLQVLFLIMIMVQLGT